MSSGARRLQWLGAAGRPQVTCSWQDRAATVAARVTVAGLAGTQLTIAVGGLLGIAAGVVLAVVLHRGLGRLEPAAVRRRRVRVQADLPLAVDLLVVAMRAGRPVGVSLRVVADGVGGPLGADLGRIAARIELGGEPRLVWAEVTSDSVLGPVGRAIVRAGDTGAPVADSLEHLVDDLQRDRLIDADEVARKVAVRSAGPLGLCFLPAFVLVGVTPTLIGAFSTLMG